MFLQLYQIILEEGLVQQVVMVVEEMVVVEFPIKLHLLHLHLLQQMDRSLEQVAAEEMFQ